MATFEVETDTNTMENPLASNGKPTELSATPSPVATSQMTEAVVGAHFESSWFSADGLLYGAGGQDKGVTLWDLETGASTTAVRTDANVLTTCAAPDDTSFVVGCGDGGFKLCAMLSPAQVRAARPPPRWSGRWASAASCAAPRSAATAAGSRRCATTTACSSLT